MCFGTNSIACLSRKGEDGWLAPFLMPMQARIYATAGEAADRHRRLRLHRWHFPDSEGFRGWACDTEMQNGSPPEAVLLKGGDRASRLYTALDMPSIVDEEKFVKAPCRRRIQGIFRTEWKHDYAKLARAVVLRDFFIKNSKVGEKTFLRRG